MPSIDPTSGTWLTPDTVAIYVQPPGLGFLPFLLTQAPVPIPGRVRLDLAETEDLERSWSITRNPVARMTAQNRIRNPDVLNITGMLSANPLQGPLRNAGMARLDKREMYKLKTILESEISFVVTPERAYKNMSCAVVREHYDAETGDGVMLTLRFDEILIAAPSLITPELDLDALLLGGGSASQGGAQTADPFADPGGLG